MILQPESPTISNVALPAHVGIIMDGNRRWARSRGLPLVMGHERGYRQAVRIAEHAFESGVKYLTLYAFSVENWNRAALEVRYLMRLMLKFIGEQSKRLHAQGIRLRVLGSQQRLSRGHIAAIRRAEELTRHNSRGTLLVAFNYGGRDEIIQAVKSIIRKKIAGRVVANRLMDGQLQTAGVPDPDLIIRTSGEQRLSGFLTWQSAYSELYFSPKMWPSFNERDFNEALREYSRRKRRFGA